ncbi:MAG: CapA family protein [Candidatus Saccharicenans sp.]
MISIYFVGDIMLSRNVGNKIDKGELNFFEPIKDILKEADILCGNLESPISDNAMKIGSFRASTNSIDIIKMFHILNLANNHIYDCGSEGIRDTLSVLKKHNILSVGIGENIFEAYKPVILEHLDEKIAFIGCTTYKLFQGIKNYDSRYCIATLGIELNKTIEALRKTVDFIVVLVHGGEEFISFPPPSLKKDLESLISKGANVIITHHPHVIGGYQLIECENSKRLIWYSLGDFLFDAQIKRRRETGILVINIEKNNIKCFNFIPLYINENYHLKTADDNLANYIIRRIKNVSEVLKKKDYRNNYLKLYLKELIEFQKDKYITLFKNREFFFLLKYMLKSLKYTIYILKKIISGGYK